MKIIAYERTLKNGTAEQSIEEFCYFFLCLCPSGKDVEEHTLYVYIIYIYLYIV